MTNRTTALALIAAAGAVALPIVGHASAPPTTEPADATSVAEGAAAADLSAVCPDTIVIQTDWFPESEYGAVYGLLGDDYEIDVENKIVSGVDGLQGQPTGVGIEIRAGGPAIGSDVETELYTKDEITFAFGTTDGQILSWEDTPMLSVVAPLDINPQIIMWDPETYPDVATIADLGEAGVTINVFGGQTFTDVLVGQGILTEDQIDPSYDGGPTRFIGENGAIAQQGFASSEPYQYEQVFEDWMKPVAFQTIHDAGFQVYSQTLAIRPEDLETLRPASSCSFRSSSSRQSTSSTDPTRTNEAIVDIVEQYDTFWQYDLGLAAYSVETQAELGLTGNGPDGTIGNMDEARIETVLQQVRDAGPGGPRGSRRRQTCSPTSSSTRASGWTRSTEQRRSEFETDDYRSDPSEMGPSRGRPHPLPRVDRRSDRRGTGRRRQGDAGRRP